MRGSRLSKPSEMAAAAEIVVEEAEALKPLTNVSSVKELVIGLETVQRREVAGADHEREYSGKKEDASFARRRDTEQRSAERKELGADQRVGPEAMILMTQGEETVEDIQVEETQEGIQGPDLQATETDEMAEGAMTEEGHHHTAEIGHSEIDHPETGHHTQEAQAEAVMIEEELQEIETRGQVSDTADPSLQEVNRGMDQEVVPQDGTPQEETPQEETPQEETP